jgi:hypothetical protein
VNINLDNVSGLSVLSQTQLGLIDRLKAIDLMFLQLEVRNINRQINKQGIRRLLIIKFIHFYLKIDNTKSLIFESKILRYFPKSRRFLIIIKKLLTYFN